MGIMINGISYQPVFEVSNTAHLNGETSDKPWDFVVISILENGGFKVEFSIFTLKKRGLHRKCSCFGEVWLKRINH